jgi:lysophospholipase L1-like esterase
MVAIAQAQGRRVCLATIAPVRPATPLRADQQSRIPGFNDRVRALAASRNVPLVDVYRALEGNMNRYIGVDNLHPTVQGYEAIADAFAETIRTAFEVGGTPAVSPK